MTSSPLLLNRNLRKSNLLKKKSRLRILKYIALKSKKESSEERKKPFLLLIAT